MEAKKLYPENDLVVLSVGTGLNKRPLKGPDSKKWGLIGWMMHDLFGLMVESSMDHELAEELIGKNYLRINSPLGRVNRRLDDNSDSNIERIISMGEGWWDEFGERALVTWKMKKYFFLISYLIVSGCSVNPVTGKQDFVLISENEEIEMGKRYHAQILKQVRLTRRRTTKICTKHW